MDDNYELIIELQELVSRMRDAGFTEQQVRDEIDVALDVTSQ